MVPNEPPHQTLEYDAESGRYVLQPHVDERVYVELLLAIASIDGVDPADMRPLAEYCDPELVDALYEATATDVIDVDGSIELAVEGHRVTFEDGGTLTIEPPA